jgi:hypothetical protein
MPIGAAIGGAAIAGVGTVASGALSAGATRHAADTAADTSLQTAEMNNELFRETRDQNLAIASPFYNNGLLAGNALTDLLLGTHTFNPATVSNPTTPGGGTFPTTGGSSGTGTTGALGAPPFTAAQIAAMRSDGISGNAAAAEAANNAWYSQHNSGALSGYQPAPVASQASGMTAAQRAAAYGGSNDYAAPTMGPQAGGALSSYHAPGAAPVATATPALPATPAATPAGTVTTPALTAQSAWDQFRNSTNYTFRLNHGQDALESNWAAHGALDSGAASKAIVEYGQNFAANELSNYMNLLASQQAAGLSAAGAVMGVGTSYAGNRTLAPPMRRQTQPSPADRPMRACGARSARASARSAARCFNTAWASSSRQ